MLTVPYQSPSHEAQYLTETKDDRTDLPPKKKEWWNYLGIPPLVTFAAWLCTFFLLDGVYLYNSIKATEHPSSAEEIGGSISDVAALPQKPWFIVAATCIGASYAVTLTSLYINRYDKRLYGFDEERYKKVALRVAVGAAYLAGVSLILASIFDIAQYPGTHRVWVNCFFAFVDITAFIVCSLYVIDLYPYSYLGNIANELGCFCGIIIGFSMVACSVLALWCEIYSRKNITAATWLTAVVTWAYLLGLSGFCFPPWPETKLEKHEQFTDEQMSQFSWNLQRMFKRASQNTSPAEEEELISEPDS